MDTVIYIIAGPLFLISLAAHLYVKVRLRPKDDSDFDDYYHEFEDLHPGFREIYEMVKNHFIATAIAVLLLFVAASI